MDEERGSLLANYPVASLADAHHPRFAQTSTLGRKVSDEFTVPLCRGHHRELHRQGDEAVWWQKLGLDPTTTARALWLQTHPLGENKLAVVASDSSGRSRRRSSLSAQGW
jgi:hypothetical protein